MKTISAKLKKYLAEKGYKYEVIEHKTTYTAWDTAQTQKIKPQEVAKTLILNAGKDYWATLIPANRYLDFKKILKLVNARRQKQKKKPYAKIGLASEAWMKKHLWGKVGATAPFGGLLKCDIYLDKLLLRNRKMYLRSGEYNLSLRVLSSQYVKNEKPVTGSFSLSKK